MPERCPRPNQRVALVVQYVGSGFYGWQRQPQHRTVQEDLEITIASLAGHPVTVHAAGRTDTGVHAAAQVAHFDVTSPIPARKWAVVLNNHLPDGILVRASAPVSFDWHAQFSATWRRYRYTLYTEARPNLFVDPFVWHYYREPIDETAIRTALTPLLGRHHLSAFRRAGSNRAHSWVDVQDVLCYRRGPFVTVEVQASGFLYGMMRLLVGMLVQVGTGRRSIEEFHHIWKNERREAVKYAAPAKGLCFLSVGYPDSPFPPEARSNAMPHFAFDPLPISC
ncbi:tRNA pseudouridine(38-40) synthase TruA [Baaleninema sp.]|uniref:tRNA pseudouridine(38-40) synthase TruA n=1 Tax=Baaleninema sp. TaxID=3101197 RepID=UPI003D027659